LWHEVDVLEDIDMRDPELTALINDLKALKIEKTWTAERAAKATYGVIRKHAALHNQKPDIETFIRAPGEERHFRDATCWVVAWEAGPWEWGIAASLSSAFPALVEPYYSFDLTFAPVEWGTDNG